MTDDAVLPKEHPHSDRPNWRPEDDPIFAAIACAKRMAHEKRTTLRTLARLRTLVHRQSYEELAELLLSYGLHPGDVLHLSTMLEGAADHMAKLNKRTKRKCLECGEEIDWDFGTARADTRYCDARCRQKAYRKRLKAHMRLRKCNE
jgi:hypothetical protein